MGETSATAAKQDLDPSFRWDDVRYFLAVAREGSMTLAGRALSTDHTTVMRRVRALEEALGASLFRYDGRRTVLTTEGSAALAEAKVMEASAGSFGRAVYGSTGKLAGDVRVWITEGLAHCWLFPRIKEFRTNNPQVKLSWFITNSEAKTVGAEVDLAITPMKPAGQEDVVLRRLGGVGYSLYATADYIARHGDPAKASDIDPATLIQFAPYLLNPAFKPWNRLFPKSWSGDVVENTTSIRPFLLTGDNVTLLPDYATLVDPAIVRLSPVLGITTDLWIAYHSSDKGNRRIKAVAEEIIRLADADRGTWFM